MESVHFVPDQCANFASHFSSVKIFQIDLFNFASHFIRVQIFQIFCYLKNEKFLFPTSHCNFGIVHCSDSDSIGIQPKSQYFLPQTGDGEQVWLSCKTWHLMESVRFVSSSHLQLQIFVFSLCMICLFRLNHY